MRVEVHMVMYHLILPSRSQYVDAENQLHAYVHNMFYVSILNCHVSLANIKDQISRVSKETIQFLLVHKITNSHITSTV